MNLIEVKHLKTYFYSDEGVNKAVNDISFEIPSGKTVCIVGESGSGKSITAMSIMQLIDHPGKIEGGEIILEGRDLLTLSDAQMRKVRGRDVAMIFQDPMTSLNPFLKISTQLTEPLEIHEGISGKKALHRAIDALDEVGIPEPEKRIQSYPHEFSGGMRQRVMIAMALITRPELLICDEPTTALDVTVQKQVLDLIKDRQEKLGTAVILITHDLAVVHQTCDVVNVMYAGRIIERAETKELFAHPLHAYTRALMKSIPATQKKGKKLYTIPGTPPDLSQPLAGCSFQPRNTLGDASKCLTDTPPPLEEISPNHFAQNCPGCLT